MMSRRAMFLVVVGLGLGACGSSGPKSAASAATGVTPATAAATAAVSTLSATVAPPVTVVVTVLVTSAVTEPVTLPTVAPTPVTAAQAPQAPVTQPKPKPTTPKTAAPTEAPTTIPALYAEVSSPVPPKDNTADVPDDGSLPNGVYYADYSGGEKMQPSMRVQQAFFGAACQTKAAEFQQTCTNGMYIPSSPDRETNLPFADNVRLTVVDEQTLKSYRITPDELVRIRASSPSDGAPDGYSFTNFGFLMTFSNGKIVKFEQFGKLNQHG